MEEEVNKVENKQVVNSTTDVSVIKVISSSLPLFTVIIIILGLVKLVVYYSKYNVPIKFFIQISEIGLIVSYDLLLVMIMFLYFTIQGANQIEIKTESKTLKKASKIVGQVVTFLPVLVVVITIIFLYIEKDYANKVYLFSLLIFSGSLALIIAYPDYFIKYITNRTRYLLLQGFIITVCFVLVVTASEIKSVEKGKYKGTIIITADSTYISTDSSYFIGKTENYVFVFNKKDTTTSIIPSELITKMILKSKPY